MRWVAEPGPDLKELEGSYVFNEVADGRTEVVYGLKVEPSFTIPGFLRRQAEKQFVGTALRGLRKRVESLGLEVDRIILTAPEPMNRYARCG